MSRFYVAYSGGLDSSVLLHALAACRDALDAPLAAVHVDHALLPQAAAWSAHCRAECAALDVPLQVLAVDVSPQRAALGVEAAARRARYSALAGLLRPADCLLTAHHRDDQAETLLLQLVRGSGPAGLAAMPEVAPLGRGRLARPLLRFERAELEAYAHAAGIRYVDDPSNRDSRLGRGFLRSALLPLLKARWPGVTTTLARAARHAADAAAIIDERAAEDLTAIVGPARWRVSTAALARLPLPRRRAVLRHWCRTTGVRPPDTARLDELLAQLARAGAARAIEVAWPGGGIRRYRDGLYLAPDLPPHDPRVRLPWDAAEPLELPAGLGTLRLESGGTLRRDVLCRGLAVVFRGPGLRCAPVGRRGHHGLKHLFQEAGIAPWLRDRVPLIVVGGELAAIADQWVCTEFATGDWAAGLKVVWDRPGYLDVSTPARPPPAAGGGGARS